MLNKKTKYIIKQALREDIGKGDITTSIVVPSSAIGIGVVVAKEEGLLCGIEIAKAAFKELDKKIIFKALKKDGDTFKAGAKIAIVKGKAAAILTAERVALNFLSLLSGVSTATKKLTDKIKNTKVKILDTRKTTPNLRELEKYAVRVGGGYNHRSSLAKGIIIKDNHFRAAQCMGNRRLSKDKINQLILLLRKKSSYKVEVEVESLKEFKAAIECRPDIIMLDNFSAKDLKIAVNLRNKYFPEIKLEASGGISLQNIKKVAGQGVDFVSVGRITHSFCAIDFSLDFL